MITFSLQSGSNGNCIYVEADGVRLLFDAGISGRTARNRMAHHGRDIRTVQALIVSHDHHDHVSGAGVLHRLFGIPIYITRPTAHACRHALGKTASLRHFASGDTLEFGPLRVHTLRTPHDAVDGIAFVVECGGRRLGIFTDLGHPFAAFRAALGDVHAAYIESNYDPEMLESGGYPEPLKARIRGDGGHLSNEESAACVRADGRGLHWAALAHLSENNNRAELALEAHRCAVGRDFPLFLAPRSGPSEILSV
ncbi:MAG: MBL fold metallo-hydrolase [Phycisphaerae bacterium]|jgi:phosphoribosyl 1,2-cyclic phosphodiesterase